MSGKHRKPKDTRLSRAVLAVAAVAGTSLATPAVAHAEEVSAAPASVWDQLAMCEASGNWSANTGNGFYGGLQFTLSTWRAFGGSGMPQNASRVEQIRVAQAVLKGQGWSAWPVCSKKINASSSSSSSETSSSSGVASEATPPSSLALGVRASDGTGIYLCATDMLYFDACDPDTLGQVVQFPHYD